MEWPRFKVTARYELSSFGGDPTIFKMEFECCGSDRDMAAFNAGAFAEKHAPDWAYLKQVTLEEMPPRQPRTSGA